MFLVIKIKLKKTLIHCRVCHWQQLESIVEQKKHILKL